MTGDLAIIQSLLDNMNSALILFSDDLRIKYINQAGENLLKTSLQHCENESIEKVFAEDGAVPEGLSKAQLTGQPFSKRKTTLQTKHAEGITVDYTVTPLPNGSDLLMEIQALDRALKISKEEMLITSQEASRKLIRGLAHEIKNPLGGLRGAAQLLERELPSRELSDYTDIIIKEADRLRNLVDQMLGPNNALNMQPLNIHETLEHIRKLLLAETQFNFNIRFDYDPSIPDIYADKEQLVQALLNITRNAIQVMTEANTDNAQLTIRTRIQRQFTIGQDFHRLMLRIDIEDNGPGISPELRENLFFPMVTGREGGTGLGLSISQTIISQHKGLIKFDSEYGKTIFSIFLPLDQRNGTA
jgi:two-component system nitrogen regulation sensor histidine kinase GlnL